jgi:hypothetical protein
VPRRLPLVIAVLAGAGIVAVVALGARTETATGVIVAVDAGSISDVRGFTLRKTGGATIEFRIGTLENAEAFPPGHLVEHIATGSKVTVTYRVIDGVPTAARLEDAPEPAAT